MKRKITTVLCLGIATMLVLFSCKKEKTPPPYLGYDYIPNHVGHWVIYNIDSIVVNPFAANHMNVDTFQYQVKEIIDSFYYDNTGRQTQVIIRYKLPKDSTKWIYQKTWTANLLASEALRNEDGITYVKLTFPVKLNNAWNGGAFNAGLDWDQSNFQYTSINNPANINGHYFDSTTVVLQDSNVNGLTDQYFLEQYATNTGLIYKRIIDLQSSPTVSFVIGQDPNQFYQDSIALPSDWIYLIEKNELKQGSVIYTQTYVSSGN